MMQTTITARHCDITDALRARAEEVGTRLAELSPHALECTFVFDAEALLHRVEIRLHARRRKVLIGVGEGPDHRTALDRAEEKLRPQLLRAGRSRAATRRTPIRDA
jgi:ribosomal subunit interface protein